MSKDLKGTTEGARRITEGRAFQQQDVADMFREQPEGEWGWRKVRWGRIAGIMTDGEFDPMGP